MSARRIDCAQVRTGGHTGPPLRWKLPPRRAVHPKRSRLSFRNEKKLRILLADELRKHRLLVRSAGSRDYACQGSRPSAKPRWRSTGKRLRGLLVRFFEGLILLYLLMLLSPFEVRWLFVLKDFHRKGLQVPKNVVPLHLQTGRNASHL